MAQQNKPATLPAASTLTVQTFPKGTPTPEAPNCTFGPFGDKALHGSKLLTDTAKASTTKEAFEGKSLHWEFSHWGVANAQEARKLLDAKPEMVCDLINTALGTKARAASWGENRGGASTMDVRVNGVLHERVPIALMEMLKANAKTFEIVPRVKRSK